MYDDVEVLETAFYSLNRYILYIMPESYACLVVYNWMSHSGVVLFVTTTSVTTTKKQEEFFIWSVKCLCSQRQNITGCTRLYI